MMDTAEIRKAALSRLHGLLEQLAKPTAIIRYPEGVIVDDGVEMSNSEYVARMIEQIQPGDTIALPHTVDSFGNHEWDYSFPPNQSSAALNGLAWLLGLTGEEAGFIRALMEKPTDSVGIMAFADWLEERGRDAEAARMREAAGVA